MLAYTQRRFNRRLWAFVYAVMFALGAVILDPAISNTASAQSEDGRPSHYSVGVEAFQAGDYRLAFDSWSLGAYEDSTDAQYNLGVLYIEGLGVERNLEQARFWFLRAAEKLHVEALYNLGHLSLDGLGVEKDIHKALDWWKQAAEGGYAPAQFNYGRALYLGIGGQHDINQGRTL